MKEETKKILHHIYSKSGMSKLSVALEVLEELVKITKQEVGENYVHLDVFEKDFVHKDVIK